MRQIERNFRAALFLSRWLIAPFLVGLVLALLLLIYRFFADFYELAIQISRTTWHELIVGVLNMIDIALTANVVIIVIFSGYENFIRKFKPEDSADWPNGLTEVDFMALKQRLMGSIVIIAAVDALAWFLDLEKYAAADTAKLGWAVAFPLMFVVAMLLLSIADWLGRPDRKAE
jgi:uncharacterized protein (TIGR00645 family)